MRRRFVLLLGLVVLQAIALVVVLGITYWASQDVLLRYAESLAARIARDATAYTEEFLDPANDAVRLGERLSESGVLDPGERDTLARFFFELLRTQEYLDGAYFGSKTGAFVFVNRDDSEDGASYRLKVVETEPVRDVRLTWYGDTFEPVATRTEPEDDFDPRNRPWYAAALEQDDLAWTEPYIFFSSRKPGITVSVPVTDPAGGATLGAMGIDIRIEALSAFLQGLDISPRGSAAIIGETGDIIAHSDEALVAVPAEGGRVRFNTVADAEDPVLIRAERAVEGGIDGLFPGEIRLARFEADGEVWLAAVQRMSAARSPWTVVTYLPESDMLTPLWRVRNIALGVALAALVATAAIGLLYGRVVMNTAPRGAPPA